MRMLDTPPHSSVSPEDLERAFHLAPAFRRRAREEQDFDLVDPQRLALRFMYAMAEGRRIRHLHSRSAWDLEDELYFRRRDESGRLSQAAQYVDLLWFKPDGVTSRAFRALDSYGIPFSQSPGLEGVTLGDLWKKFKIQQVLLFPIAVGGLAAGAAIWNGECVLALQVAGTGSFASVILIGAVSIADKLVPGLRLLGEVSGGPDQVASPDRPDSTPKD